MNTPGTDITNDDNPVLVKKSARLTAAEDAPKMSVPAGLYALLNMDTTCAVRLRNTTEVNALTEYGPVFSWS